MSKSKTQNIYQLYHFKITLKEDCDEEGQDMRLIGIYSKESDAYSAIERLRGKPGFRKWPDGFRVFETPLDRGSWQDGFVDAYDDPEWPSN